MYTGWEFESPWAHWSSASLEGGPTTTSSRGEELHGSSLGVPTVSATGDRPRRSQRERLRLTASVALAAVAVLFAALNVDHVRVNWVVTTTDTPLIVVIAACVLVGVAIGWILARRRAR